MPTQIFDSSLTSDALRAGISTIDVQDLNRQINERLAFLANTVSELTAGIAQPVPSEGKMVDVTPASSAMVKVGEFGDVAGEADRRAVELNFPLWKFKRKTGWTYDFLRLATVEDFRHAFLQTEEAYLTAVEDEIKAAVYNNVRREFDDKFGKSQRTGLLARPFYNADGMVIPPAPNGTTFVAASHQHYNGTSGSSVSVYDIDTLLINNVVEHGNMRGIALFVPSTLKPTLLSITSTKFLEVTRPNVVYADSANRSAFQDNLDSDPDNKLIGTWDGYPVFSRSWCPASTIACFATGAPEKPLGLRQDGGLTALPENSNNILTAKDWLAYFGMAANNRGAGAVLDTAHQTNYTAPTLTL